MNKALFLLICIAVNYQTTAQITSIPDSNFEQALIDLGIDSDGEINGQILTADDLAVTVLNISPVIIPNYPLGNGSYKGMIYDLKGIEDFVNLEKFTVSTTMVEELNLGTLINLKYLDCVDNMLTFI